MTVSVASLGSTPVVYFVQIGRDGPIKLGVSRSFERHLETLRAHNHATLRPLGVMRFTSVDGARGHERALHLRFSSYCLHHKWYRTAPELIAYIRDHVEGASEVVDAPSGRVEVDEYVGVGTGLVETLVTAECLAAWLQVSPKIILRLAYRRRIPHLRVGKLFRFRMSEIANWINQQRDEDLPPVPLPDPEQVPIEQLVQEAQRLNRLARPDSEV